MGTKVVGTTNPRPVRFVKLICGICNDTFTGRVSNLKKAKSCKSCSIKQAVQYTITHGKYKDPLYNIWQLQKKRSSDTLDVNYAGRGITMCKEFRESFELWLSHVTSLDTYNPGDKSLTLDRIDNDKGYCVGNLRWATKTIQALNRRVFKNNSSGHVNITKLDNCPINPFQCQVKGHPTTYHSTLEDAIKERDAIKQSIN
jgi:hypothetical protein